MTRTHKDNTPPPGLRLAVLPETLAVCRMAPKARIPKWIHDSPFYSISRSPEELSLICAEQVVPEGIKHEGGWRAFKVVGTLDMTLMAVLAALSLPLAENRIGLITVSTFETDYMLVRAKQLEKAMAVLARAGHRFEGSESESAAPAAEKAQKTSPAPALADEPAVESEKGEDDEEKTSSTRRRRSRRGSRRRRAGENESSDGNDDSPTDAETPVPHAVTEAAPAATVLDTDDPRPSMPASDLSMLIPGLPPLPAMPRDLDEPPEVSGRPPVTAEIADKHEGERPEELQKPADDKKSAATDLPADEADPVPDDDPVADGLFTGAIPQNPVETTEDSFESLGISPGLIETLEGIGFTHPTPIQAAVIPIALEGGDLIGLAETGSGKTAAFGLPLAERLHHGRGLRGLILCPTREIALQTKAFLDIFGKEHDLETAVIIGGVKFGPQLQALKRNPDIIVATPGRLADHLRRGNVRLNRLEELVLDEADHMLDLGFLPQIQEILESIPKDHRTLMFSATMPPAIERLAQRFLNDPYTADLRPVNRVASGIRHRLYLVKDGDQKSCLINLLEQEEGTTLVFARRKLDTEWLARQLEIAGLPVDRIHSDRSQSQRVRALRTFREGEIRILVATDVAARGIDVPQLSHVVNFGLPESIEDYVHRAGRTARGKAVGTVSSIGTWLDKVMVKDIERLIGHEIERCEVEGVDAYRELRPKRKSIRRRLL